jgi:hypothetical protein
MWNLDDPASRADFHPRSTVISSAARIIAGWMTICYHLLSWG